MYLVGKIIGTHGIKGEVKVKADTSFPRFEKGSKLILKLNDQETEIQVNSHRIHKGLDLITFNNYQNINDILQFVGAEIYVEHKDDELNENEYYFEDLIGRSVINTNEELLGKVIDIREVPQGIILEVQGKDKIFLVPFVSEFIIEVDEVRIVINVIEGLI